MHQQAANDGLRLDYERTGSGPALLLLHGWPGDRTDYRAVVPLVSRAADVVVPDLRGFGESDKHPADPALQYNAAGQARSIAGLIGELGLGQVVLAGRTDRRAAGRRPGVPEALLVALVRPGLRARRRAPRPPGVGLRAAGRVHRLDRLVPGGRRVGRGLAGRKGPRPTGPDQGAHHRAVAGTRPAVPARMVRPDRPVLRRCPSDLARRRRPLLG